MVAILYAYTVNCLYHDGYSEPYGTITLDHEPMAGEPIELPIQKGRWFVARVSHDELTITAEQCAEFPQESGLLMPEEISVEDLAWARRAFPRE